MGKIIKTACITAATALMLGVFATPQTEVFNQTVNTAAKVKVKKTRYKNGKIKTKTITDNHSKKYIKKYKLKNPMKYQEKKFYYKNGRLKRIQKTTIVLNALNKQKLFVNKSIWNEYYTNSKNRKIKYQTFKGYISGVKDKKLYTVRDYKYFYNKKGILNKRIYVDNYPWLGDYAMQNGQKWSKRIEIINKKGKMTSAKYYVFARLDNKYKKTDKKTYMSAFYRYPGDFKRINRLNLKKWKYIYNQ